jgi:hypothetical protein
VHHRFQKGNCRGVIEKSWTDVASATTERPRKRRKPDRDRHPEAARGLVRLPHTRITAHLSAQVRLGRRKGDIWRTRTSARTVRCLLDRPASLTPAGSFAPGFPLAHHAGSGRTRGAASPVRRSRWSSAVEPQLSACADPECRSLREARPAAALPGSLRKRNRSTPCRGDRFPSRSALGNLQLAPDVEAGALFDHERRHRLAPFRLDL